MTSVSLKERLDKSLWRFQVHVALTAVLAAFAWWTLDFWHAFAIFVLVFGWDLKDWILEDQRILSEYRDELERVRLDIDAEHIRQLTRRATFLIEENAEFKADIPRVCDGWLLLNWEANREAY